MSTENGKTHAMHTMPKTSQASSGDGGNNYTTTISATTSRFNHGTTNFSQSVMNSLIRLAPARDFTLGGCVGFGGTKKVFKPNLNVTRNKNGSVKVPKDFTVGRGRHIVDNKKVRDAHADSVRGKSTLVQTTGIFSEGVGTENTRKRLGSNFSDLYERSSQEYTSAQASKTTAIKDSENSLTTEDLAPLLSDDDLFDDDCIEDDTAENNDWTSKPVEIFGGDWDYKPEQKLDPNIERLYPKVHDSNTVSKPSQALRVCKQENTHLITAIIKHNVYPASLDEFFNRTEAQNFLMQLPDVLPNFDDDPITEKGATALNNGEKDDKTDPKLFNVFDEMSDGQVGKIVRYKSGKVKLVLGETLFDLNMSVDPGYLQDLMSVNVNPEQRSGNIFNLGQIHAKINVAPDWKYLIEEKSQIKKNQSL